MIERLQNIPLCETLTQYTKINELRPLAKLLEGHAVTRYNFSLQPCRISAALDVITCRIKLK